MQIILLLSVFPFLLLSDGVKHSDMRKVYVDLLCGRFAMLCAFFVYHDLGYKGSDDLGCEHFDIDELFCESYTTGNVLFCGHIICYNHYTTKHPHFQYF